MTISLVATGPDSIKDIKTNNILVNYGHDSARFSEVQLGDCGDMCMIDPNADPLQGHVIGAAIFRSPEQCSIFVGELRQISGPLGRR